MPDPTRVLLVEDDPSYATLVRAQLDRSRMGAFALERRESLAAGLERLGPFDPDVVLLDLNLPDSSGLATVDAVISRAGRAAVVVLTGDEHDDVAIEAMRRGADDFLAKERFRDIARTVLYSVERRRAEAEKAELRRALFEAQKQEAIGRVAAGVAQDINNALTVIAGSCSLAREQLAPEHPVREELDEIVAAYRRASQLVEQLLSFARKQILRPEVRPVDDVVRSLTPTLRRIAGARVSLEVVPGAGDRAVSLDPGQFRQALEHLVTNARDASPAGAAVRIETAASGGADANVVCVTVRDAGTGMAPDVARRAFEPFFSTKGPGASGLGLSMVQGMVAQAGGRAEVESRPGRGTAVRLYFPVGDPDGCAAAPPSSPAAPAAEPPPARGRHVLVCDDDPRVRRAAVRALRRAGFTVSEAGSGEEALTVLAAADDVDVLLTDIVMPEMNGRELAERVRALRPVEVVYMSGYSEETISRQGVLEEGARLLGKPFDAEGLVAAVSRA